MGRSSLLGAETAELQPMGRSIAALGPGDNSDSGSDVAGLDGWSEGADPSGPVDVALRGNRRRSALPPAALDISVDRVFDLGDRSTQAPVDDLSQVDQAGVPDAEEDKEEDDESADPVGDRHSDAGAARRLQDWPSGRGSRRRH